MITRRAATLGAARTASAAAIVGTLTPGAVAAAAKAGPHAPLVLPAPRLQPNVLLVTIDTLRSDHVGAGPRAAKTPVLDRLASEGVYGNTYVQLPQTLPNHASMLTGTYVQTHGLRTTLWNQARDSVPTLDQLYRAAGYRTAGIVSWYSFDQEFTNLVRAWDTWEQVMVRAGTAGTTRERVSQEEAMAAFRAGAEMGKVIDGDARVTTDAALRWLEEEGRRFDRPWFFWLHYRDPHYPFTPPASYDERPTEAGGFDGGYASLGRITNGYAPAPSEMAGLLAAYNGEITYTDSELGRLVRRLEELRLDRNTILVVTADHGSSFLEQGAWDWLHGHSVYEASVRVPLIVRYPARPDAVQKGLLLNDPVQTADLAPTLLELCGLPVPPGMEGRSIVDLLATGETRGIERSAWGTIFDDSQSYVVSGEWKMVRWNDPARRTGVELYHLASDPRETRDYLAEVPAVAARLRASLESWLEAQGAGRHWQPWA